MKQNAEKLTGYKMGAIDGELGEVKTFYFDDKTWTVRYLVVETGNWLFGKKVLISPKALLQPNWEERVFPTNLTRKQIEESPDVDTAKPVSAQQEVELYNHYHWGDYWGAIGTSGMMMPVVEPFDMAIKAKLDKEKHHSNYNLNLRSTAQVKGYCIEALDGEIGDMEDFIIDGASWEINFIVVDTGQWFSGRKVLISPQWIKDIDWATSKVVVDATEIQIENSPVYDPNIPINDVYSNSLYDYYGRRVRY